MNRERGFNCVDAMREIGDARGVSVARIAPAWLLHRSVVTSVIIGAKTNEQLGALPAEYPGWMVERQNTGRIPQA